MPKEPNTPTADLVAALAELDNVKANKVNPGFKNRYVSLDALLDAIKPVLLGHNLALIQTLISEEGKVGINTAFLHASGERFDFGRLMVKAEGLDAQKIGGAITYIRRQSIQTACGISVDLDDDGATAASGFRSAAVSPVKAAPAPSGPWYAFLTATEAERAHEYLTKKGWLPESAQDLSELSPDKVELIVGNKPAFLKAIK